MGLTRLRNKRLDMEISTSERIKGGPARVRGPMGIAVGTSEREITAEYTISVAAESDLNRPCWKNPVDGLKLQSAQAIMHEATPIGGHDDERRDRSPALSGACRSQWTFR